MGMVVIRSINVQNYDSSSNKWFIKLVFKYKPYLLYVFIFGMGGFGE